MEGNNMFQYAFFFVAGLVFGLANVIPGVSGGTMAVVFGIYERLIGLIANFRTQWKKDLGFIIPLGLGAGIAILAFGKVMDWVLTYYPALANSFFVGVIIGSLPMLFQKAWRTAKGAWKIRVSNILPMLVTLGIMLWMTFTTPAEAAATEVVFGLGTALKMLLFGAVATACMIIPGISGSFVMVMLGAYSIVINAIANLNFLLLAPFALGALIGLFGCAKLIRFLLKKYEMATYSAILGFVIGSIPAVFPGFGAMSIGAVICLIAGVAAIVLCNKFGAE